MTVKQFLERSSMALATASASMETSTLVESRVQHSYQEVQVSERQTVKKKKSRRHHKEEGSISVSKSSEKLHKKLSANAEGPSSPPCAKCSRPVFAMERVKAERRVYHKECFRCAQCSKQLTVETYQSDHTTLYCKPHFKQLFEPKPVDDDDEVDATPKKHQMIICENNPVELPPDVVRASDKPELGLEELTQLDVKSRFEMFENAGKTEQPRPISPPPHNKEKSRALLAKLAKFKAKGMDIGVSDEYLNGVPVEPSSSEPEEEDDEDSVLKRSYKHSTQREAPVSFCNMSEIMTRFESGSHGAAERHRSRKQEIQNIRSRLFMGKQAKIKEMYEQSVMQSEQGITSCEKISRELEKDVDAEKARAIKQRFENGHFNDENVPPRTREVVDSSLINDGIGKKSRSIFLELDANAKNLPPTSPPPQEAPKRKEIPFIPKDLVRAEDKVEDVKIETADISDRFKFFETYRPQTQRKEFRMTPPRQTQRAKSPSPEVYHEPGVVRSSEPAADAGLAASRHTATKMINVFRQMEESLQSPEDTGPKPLKCFTPPPPGEHTHTGDTSSSGDEGEDYSSEEEYCRTAEHDEGLKQAQQLARTKSFRDRFENWSESEPRRPPRDVTPTPSAVLVERDDDGDSQLETAKSLRQKFESMNVTTSSVSKTGVAKVNRFV